MHREREMQISVTNGLRNEILKGLYVSSDLEVKAQELFKNKDIKIFVVEDWVEGQWVLIE